MAVAKSPKNTLTAAFFVSPDIFLANHKNDFVPLQSSGLDTYHWKSFFTAVSNLPGF